MSEKHRFHFTGICGTAMGAVAAAMKQRGFKVSGSDANVYPPMSDFLRREGIVLTEGYRAENIPADAEVIVIGNAISRGNPEAEAALDRKLLYMSLPEVMKEYFLRGNGTSWCPARTARRRPPRCSLGCCATRVRTRVS